MDDLWNAGFDFEEEDEDMHHITDEHVIGVVDEFRKEQAVYLQDLLKQQQEERVFEARNNNLLELEEAYMIQVRCALAQRRDPHPLEELAAMRAEDAFTTVMERMARLEAMAGDEDYAGPSGKEMMSMLEGLVGANGGLALSELHRQEEGDAVVFSDPIVADDEDGEAIDYNIPDSDDEQAMPDAVASQEVATEADKESDAPGADASPTEVPPAAPEAAPEPEKGTPATPEDDRAAIQRMIEDRRKARQPSRPVFSTEDDNMFSELDAELQALKENFFAEDGDDLEYMPSGGGEDGESMHRFKYLSPALKNVRSLPSGS